MFRRLNEIKEKEVQFLPERLETGVLYVSTQIKLAIHLCACGYCGYQIVTPINEKFGWNYKPGPTLDGFIGNNKSGCCSRYFITEGNINWVVNARFP